MSGLDASAAFNLLVVQADILLPALAAGLLVLATHVPLGREVLRRGIIFMDLAIAQFAGLGIVIAQVSGLADALSSGETGVSRLMGGWTVQLAAVGAALLGALLLRWGERRAPRHQEALIGSAFVVAASAAILLLAKDPQGGEHLQELLVGQILWSNWGSLLPLAVLSLLAWVGWNSGLRHQPLAFYVLFALLVTASVQVVGVYLVFASLIIPALAAGTGGLWCAYGIGVAGYALGLLASALLDLPAGAAIVLALAACAILQLWRRGLPA